MSDQPTTKAGVPTRDFTDAGTEESFTKGTSHDFGLGAHANYLAAGLITVPEVTVPAETAA